MISKYKEERKSENKEMRLQDEFNPKRKYRLVSSREEEEKERNEIRVSQKGKPSKYMNYGVHLFSNGK